MCGIAGYVPKNDKYQTSMELVKRMTDSLIHRGPDAEGQWCDDHVALGHRRLSIIDLDRCSNQPMISHDGKYVITYNGEIYNYIEIRKELQKKGAIFKTNSDTEVILEAYKMFGTDCLKKFNGMWAFALYDIDCHKILIARDRFAIKPLYILDNDDVLVFASEIKAILAAFPDENIPDNYMLYRYLLGGVYEDVDERTFFRNIKVFPQSTYMTYDVCNHSRISTKYWEVNEALFHDKWIKGQNPIEVFQSLFENSVELRLRADVEVGACLSGGIDSSAIVGCSSKKFGRRMHTFSSLYEDKDCNEEYYIRKVNQKWNAIPHYIRPDEYEDRFTEHIAKLTYHHDQPTGTASLYSGYMVMRGVKDKVKVLLDGQGADEMFAGYFNYHNYFLEDLLDCNTFLSKMQAVKLLCSLKRNLPEILPLIDSGLIMRAVGSGNSSKFFFPRKFGSAVVSFTEEFLDSVEQCEVDFGKQYQEKCSSKLNTKLCNDVLHVNIPNLLHNEDSNSMAFSIETRVPFLDYRIVEFSIALNGKFKIKDYWTKWIVRKACNEYLPQEIVKRKSKMGFPAPFARWLRNGRGKEEVRHMIYSLGKRRIVSNKSIENLYEAHINNKDDCSLILYRFLSLELWYRIFIDRVYVV